MSESPIVIDHLFHSFGEGELRREVLSDVCTEIHKGEIVILTGPSGSGKTTLLTLIGALRSAQEGSLRVLGRELRNAHEGTLVEVRSRIGYVFQAHNLLEALTARQNVQTSLEVDGEFAPEEAVQRAGAALEAVGLGDRKESHPSELSGGQRQRVAIARALARRPRIVLADEPTASLDRQTGRSVLELLERLARKDGVTVVLVTHDSRILDAADRILTLEDGRLSSLMNAVATDARRRLHLLVRDIRRGDLVERVEGLDAQAFRELLDQITDETRRLLELVDLVQGDAFESMLDQVARGFTRKVAQIVEADRATLFLLDEEAGEVWASDVCEHGRERDLRIPIQRGVVGQVARSGRALNVADVAQEPLFDASVDARDLPEAKRLLAIPVIDSRAHVFAVVELVRAEGKGPFETAEERQVRELTDSLGVILESWWRMSCSCRATGVGRTPPCCHPWRPASPS
ncbi:MAG: ATP-binding cassette domain-containing protein [Myxococcota bacterium]